MSRNVEDSIITPWLICGGFMIVILNCGLFIVAASSLDVATFKKKSYSIFSRPLLDICMSTVSWILVGWAFANDGDYMGFIGGRHQFLTRGTKKYAIWFYQLAMLMVACSIFSNGTLTRRLSLRGVSVSLLFFGLGIYSIIYHWAWSSSGWASPYRSVRRSSLLLGCGVLDSSGSSVIHMSGGCCGLIILWAFDRFLIHHVLARSSNHTPSNSFESIQVFSKTCGLLLSWIGTIGLNGITNLSLVDTSYSAGKRIISTCVSAASACVTAYVYCKIARIGTTSLRLQIITKSLLSGLVGIAAACSSCEFEGAFAIGVVASVLCICTMKIQQYLDIETGETAVCVHLVNGAWGLVAAGLFASKKGYASTIASQYSNGDSRALNCAGVFYGGRGYQLGANIIFGLAVLSWSCGTFILFLLAIRFVFRRKFADIEPSSDSEAVVFNSLDATFRMGSSMMNALAKPAANAGEGGISLDINLIGTDDRLVARKDVAMLVDNFEKKHGYSWDMAMILPAPSSLSDIAAAATDNETNNNNNATGDNVKPSDDHAPKKTQSSTTGGETQDKLRRKAAIEIIQALRSGGLETYQFYSLQYDEIVVKIRAPLNRLQKQADEHNYPLMLDEKETCRVGALGWTGPRSASSERVPTIKPFLIEHGIDWRLTDLRPYQFIYAPYEQDLEPQSLYASAEGLTHPFSTIHRIKLIEAIIQDRGEFSCGLNIPDLIESGAVLSYFPLQEPSRAEQLRQKWLNPLVPPWEQPDTMIRDYFGEHIALYFKFLAHYITYLLPLAVVGFGVTIHMIVLINKYGTLFSAIPEMWSVPAFSIFVSLWTSVLLMSWQSKEKRTALEWGMIGFEHNQRDRHQFIGEMTTSHINGGPMKYFSFAEARKKRRQSFIIVTSMIILVIACVAGVFFLKYFLVQMQHVKNGSSYASIVNAVQIQLLAFLYHSIAKKLTDSENCRTDTEYEDSLIVKLFAFNFVNSYAPSFYIAFLKSSVGDPCQNDSCMYELGFNLFIIFVTQLIAAKLTQTVIPMISHYLKTMAESRSSDEGAAQQCQGRTLSRVEKEYTMDTYDKVLGSIDDYSQLCIQFGYLTLFVAALPFAPILALISNYLEIRVDGYKLLKQYRRPFPSGAEDIGTWHLIFQILSVVAVFTNAGLVFYTNDWFRFLLPSERLALAVLVISVIFVLRFFVANSLQALSDEIDIQLQRQEFLIQKVIKRVPDEVEYDAMRARARHPGDSIVWINEKDE